MPPADAKLDVTTSFGTVRAYRFDGPMWRANLPGLVAHRTVYSLDLLGEAGLSVQTKPITGAQNQAQWLEETLAGFDPSSASRFARWSSRPRWCFPAFPSGRAGGS